MCRTANSDSCEMPITTIRSLNLFDRALRCGMDCRQGPHQVAQKSTNTNLPLVSGASVSHFSISRAGAGWFRKDFAWISCGGMGTVWLVSAGSVSGPVCDEL